MKLFVYGTLQDAYPRQGLRRLAAERGLAVELLGPATTAGLIYDLGAFPALTPGSGIVHGELFDVPDELIPRIDEYEGTPHHYTRRPITATFADGSAFEAWAYFIVTPPPASRRIASGNWLEHKKGQQR